MFDYISLPHKVKDFRNYLYALHYITIIVLLYRIYDGLLIVIVNFVADDALSTDAKYILNAYGFSEYFTVDRSI